MTNENLNELQESDQNNEIAFNDQENDISNEIKSLEQKDEEIITISKKNLEGLIKKRVFKGIEKGKREILNMQQQDGNGYNSNQVNAPLTLTESQIKELIADYVPSVLNEKAELFQQQKIAEQEEAIASSFISKMKHVTDSNPEIANILANDLNYDDSALKRLIFSATSLDNTGLVMSELLQNPQKLAAMQSLFREQPKLAERQLASLSESIKKNEQSISSVKQSNSPLSQIKSSSIGNNNGSMSILDFARQFNK